MVEFFQPFSHFFSCVDEFKRTLVVISNNSPFIEDHAQFTFHSLFLQQEIRKSVFLEKPQK